MRRRARGNWIDLWRGRAIAQQGLKVRLVSNVLPACTLSVRLPLTLPRTASPLAALIRRSSLGRPPPDGIMLDGTASRRAMPTGAALSIAKLNGTKRDGTTCDGTTCDGTTINAVDERCGSRRSRPVGRRRPETRSRALATAGRPRTRARPYAVVSRAVPGAV